MRRNSTRAEWVLWLELRDRRLSGFKFARQQPIGPYVVDLVCRERRVIIEVDGGQHADSISDQHRDAQLAAAGYRIIRVWNNDVLANTEGIVAMLRSELEKAPHPVPLPVNGERERGLADANKIRGAALRRVHD